MCSTSPAHQRRPISCVLAVARTRHVAPGRSGAPLSGSLSTPFLRRAHPDRVVRLGHAVPSRVPRRNSYSATACPPCASAPATLLRDGFTTTVSPSSPAENSAGDCRSGRSPTGRRSQCRPQPSRLCASAFLDTGSAVLSGLTLALRALRSSGWPSRDECVRGEPAARCPTKAAARRLRSSSRGSACASSELCSRPPCAARQLSAWRSTRAGSPARVILWSPKGSLDLKRPEDESNRADQVMGVHCKLAVRSCGRDTDATAPCGGASLSRIAS